MNDRIGGWMQTYTGRQFWPGDPRPGDFDIRDIAHGLALECRYGNQCTEHYSVAEHSLLVCEILPPEFKLPGLVHDAAEALLKDIPKPIKDLLPDYQRLESSVWIAMCRQFGWPIELPPIIKWADNAVLEAERRVVMSEPHVPWHINVAPAKVLIRFLLREEAERQWLQKYMELTS